LVPEGRSLCRSLGAGSDPDRYSREYAQLAGSTRLELLCTRRNPEP